MRLLYVIDSLTPGGAETSLAEMAPGLVHAGVELHVLPLLNRMHLAQRLRESGATVHSPPTRSGRLRNVSRIVNVIGTVRPDLVHTTLYESDVAGRIAAWLTRKPASSSVVGDTYGEHRTSTLNLLKLRLALEVDRLTSSHCSRVHAVSATLADAAVEHLRIRRERIVIIPRGRDPHRFMFRPVGVRTQVRASLGISEDSPIILAVGRHDPAKGLMDLLNAAPRLSAEFPSLVLLLAGKDDVASNDLRRRASELEIDIRFLGHREDVADLLAASDLLCFPSLSEGSPGTLIEAMAVGCPIVATSIPANLEVLGVSPQSRAWMAPPYEPDLLADAMRGALVGSVDKPREARARFESEFEINRVAERMARFFYQAADV